MLFIVVILYISLIKIYLVITSRLAAHDRGEGFRGENVDACAPRIVRFIAACGSRSSVPVHIAD